MVFLDGGSALNGCLFKHGNFFMAELDIVEYVYNFLDIFLPFERV